MNTRRLGACIFFLLLSVAANAWNQNPAVTSPAPAQPELPEDPLGRSTPRGTVRGFLSAAGKEHKETASLYLDTRLKGESAARLADQLFFVLNRGLRLQLNKISDQPEGSMLSAAEPYKDLIGRISSENGDVDVLVERIDRKDAGPIWLFSRKTLNAIPELYD